MDLERTHVLHELLQHAFHPPEHIERLLTQEYIQPHRRHDEMLLAIRHLLFPFGGPLEPLPQPDVLRFEAQEFLEEGFCALERPIARIDLHLQAMLACESTGGGLMHERARVFVEIGHHTFQTERHGVNMISCEIYLFGCRTAVLHEGVGALEKVSDGCYVAEGGHADTLAPGPRESICRGSIQEVVILYQRNSDMSIEG